MEIVKAGWNFFQSEILGMNWLNRLIRNIFERLRFRYHGQNRRQVFSFSSMILIKIMVLLGVLILIISYIQSYFPPERAKKILGRVSRDMARTIIAASARYGNTVLLVFIYSACLSGLQAQACRLALHSPFLISSPMVDLGSSCLTDEYFRLESCCFICNIRFGNRCGSAER